VASKLHRWTNLLWQKPAVIVWSGHSVKGDPPSNAWAPYVSQTHQAHTLYSASPRFRLLDEYIGARRRAWPGRSNRHYAQHKARSHMQYLPALNNLSAVCNDCTCNSNGFSTLGDRITRQPLACRSSASSICIRVSTGELVIFKFWPLHTNTRNFCPLNKYRSNHGEQGKHIVQFQFVVTQHDQEWKDHLEQR
jgi:hypothetical protein